jgi:hypothetical protein
VSIINAVRSSWTLSNNKNNELCNHVFGTKADQLSDAMRRRYYSNNDDALQAFLTRKSNGLGLSDRVWQYTNSFKTEIELGLDMGIRSGLDAASMARDLKQYLKYPDKLFRRVRDERGQLHLSKAAAEFHPGRGVYRSSYKNARRLAVTETNMAYHTADYLRWQQMDFVVGIEVRLSSNHTLLGGDGTPHEFADICDELQGRYPKDFKFTGWHPHCRCFAVSILKTEEEMEQDTQRILNGEEPTPSEDSENAVSDLPDKFKNYIQERSETISNLDEAHTPYYIRDNRAQINPILGITPPAAAVEPVTYAIDTALPPKVQNNASNRLALMTEELCNFTLQNGGSVTIPLEKIAHVNKSKQELGKFKKELRAAKRFADAGHVIVFMPDDAGSYDVLFDGVKAELKCTGSSGNIVKYAKHATREQGAEIVLFEFTDWGTPFIEEIAKLIRLGIHGRYVISGNSTIYTF